MLFKKTPAPTETPANNVEPSPLDPAPRTPDTHRTFSRLASARIECEAAKKAQHEAQMLRWKRENALREATAEEDRTYRHWQQCRADFDRRADHEEAAEKRRQAQAMPDPYDDAAARLTAAEKEHEEAEKEHAWVMFKEREPALLKVTSGEGYRERTEAAAAQFADALETLERTAREIDAAWLEARDAGRQLSKFGRNHPDFCERHRIGPVLLELIERGGPTAGRVDGAEIPYTNNLVEVVRGVRQALSIQTGGRAPTTGEQREKDIALLRRMFSARVPSHVLAELDREREKAKEEETERLYQLAKAERARKRAEEEAAKAAAERELAETVEAAKRASARARAASDDGPQAA